MREGNTKLHELELRNTFADMQSVQKAELRSFCYQLSHSTNEQSFRRFLYGLEKRQIITPIGAGVFIFHDPFLHQTAKKHRFSPDPSQYLVSLNKEVHEAFPYIKYLVWETKVLHEFMVHQPGQNLFIIETEKEVCESVFNALSERTPGQIYLDPDRITMERYVLHQPDRVIISRLVTQTPMRISQGIPSPKLEKILVDIFLDEEKYFFFQGEELVRIYENAFSSYWINEKTLLRYAGRRKVSGKLRQFIKEQTQIQLSQPEENGE
jgi:hypothetical protein